MGDFLSGGGREGNFWGKRGKGEGGDVGDCLLDEMALGMGIGTGI